jgi:superfamily II DNA or RNA helicase
MNRAIFLRKRAAATAAAKKKADSAAAAAGSGTGASTMTDSAAASYITNEYKETVLKHSYLGGKGFTIPKSVLLPVDLEDIKRELTLKPIIKGPVAPVEDILVPVYRENASKIYIPRFYAQKRYGIPSSKIGDGEPMTAETQFRGKLRDYQDNIVDIYKTHVSVPAAGGGGGLLSVPCGAGKTVIAIKIACELRRKTLIIVHKEFLLNQWIERIRDFCGADTKVGRIQGDTFDVEGKDFVIGMLQTLYARPYPETAFQCFGLLIIDETHRICSEQFSRALFRITTKYCLGISATIARKDGMETVLQYFVGDIVYHEERKGDDPVCVRAIEYISHDPEFNEVEYDFRGNVKYSTMLSKLCDCGQRTEMVVRVIKDLLIENPDQQIMVLSQYKSVLHSLYDYITHADIAPTGYYVGGMKQKDLTESEGKQIVLSTYSMSSEALDIKSLATLIMVTPKSDIIQCVGRILRMKHKNPIVVDIVDTHAVFQNQWRGRKQFYKKCNYRIRYIKSENYKGMDIEWDEDDTWKRVYEPIDCAMEGAEAGAAGAARAEKVEQNKCMIDISKLKMG